MIRTGNSLKSYCDDVAGQMRPKAEVLVVAADTVAGRDIQQILERAGYRVIGVASTGETAMAAAEVTRPELALIDLPLPGSMNGIEVARRLRWHLDVPVVFVTTQDATTAIDEAKSAEPLGWILKPFQERQLLVALEVALHRYTADRRRIGEARQRLEALTRVDTAANSHVDLSHTTEIVLRQIVDYGEADAAAVVVFEPHTQMFTYTPDTGFRTRAVGATPAVREHLAVDADRFATSHAVPLRTNATVHGALEVYHREGFEPDPKWEQFLKLLAGQLAVAVERTTLVHTLQHTNAELLDAYDATIEGWARALEFRDDSLEGHTHRVASLTVRLADAMGVPDDELVHIRRGALLHDIGKIGIPDDILLSPDTLTSDEREIMEHHPAYARELLGHISFLQPALAIPYCHHEKWDGSGYPRGLAGEEIPLAARIFAVVDVWDALTSDRLYADAWSGEAARGYIREQAGRQFDPAVVEAFLKLIETSEERSS